MIHETFKLSILITLNFHSKKYPIKIKVHFNNYYKYPKRFSSLKMLSQKNLFISVFKNINIKQFYCFTIQEL
jgi:hypothetical protein